MDGVSMRHNRTVVRSRWICSAGKFCRVVCCVKKQNGAVGTGHKIAVLCVLMSFIITACLGGHRTGEYDNCISVLSPTDFFFSLCTPPCCVAPFFPRPPKVFCYVNAGNRMLAGGWIEHPLLQRALLPQVCLLMEREQPETQSPTNR